MANQKFRIFDTRQFALNSWMKTEEAVGRRRPDAVPLPVVVVLLDAANAFEEQDQRIADLVEQSRAIVIAVNKWV